MIAALLVALTLTGPIDDADASKDCEIEDCSAATYKELWLSDRGARDEWEKTAGAHLLVIKALEDELSDTRTLLAVTRAARLAESAPTAPDPGIPTSCVWLAGGALLAGAAAGAGVCAATR